MKNVLVIDAPDAFFSFLKTKFATEDVLVTDADCNRDAFMKMMSVLPDLVILDMQRGFEDILSLLRQKRSSPNTARMPVIAIGPKVDKTQTAMFAQFGVVKYFTRPLEADVFFGAAAQAMSTDVSIDPTPCRVDVRRCAGVIFIDIEGALNRDKISVLNMDIVDLARGMDAPKVVCVMTKLHPTFIDAVNLEYLFDGILACPKVQSKNVKVIVNDAFITELLKGHRKYSSIERAANISAVLGSLVEGTPSTDSKEVIAQKMLATDPTSPTLTMSVSFGTDQKGKAADDGNVMKVAIVDATASRGVLAEQFRRAGATCDEFVSGAAAIKAAAANRYDLVVIDLMLPDGTAMAAIKTLTKKDDGVPVIVHSVPRSKEEVRQVLSLGVKRYFAKTGALETVQTASVLVRHAISMMTR